MSWLSGVRIEEFLNSYTTGSFQNIQLDSYYPAPNHFDNYVPEEFQQFMDENVQEWVNLGVLKEWSEVKSETDPEIPLVVSPLGVEPNKPRAIWDGRYVNEYCGDSPFSMDNTAKVAELAWPNAYFFKLDHKNGYFAHTHTQAIMEIIWCLLEQKILCGYSFTLWMENQPISLPHSHRSSGHVY